jgi:hypothetical protein
MTPIQTSAEPLTLDPATFNTMLRSTIEALRPRDPLEAMLAARIIALHYHAMYNLACCLRPNTPGDLQLRCQARGESLGRQSDKMRAEYLHNQQTNPARRPAGLPASAAVAPEPQPQPQPHPAPQAAADPTAEPPTARDTPNPTPAARAATAAPPAHPLKAPAPTPRSGDATPLDQAALEQMLAKAEARLQTSAVALAA